MKTYIKNPFLLPALIAGLGLVVAGRMMAQTFTTLHSFAAVSGLGSTNSDGARPLAGLILSGNKLYGTAQLGGSSGGGTAFAVNTDGTGFTTLYSFTGGSGGRQVPAGLILWDNTLYGTAEFGGSSDVGSVFAVNTDGTGFTTLHNFTARSGFSPYTNSDGAYPRAGLILSGNTLYGTARLGGSSGRGTVFAVNADGTGVMTIYSFAGGSGGANPFAGLVLLGNTLYGTTYYGSSGGGTVFAISTDGTGFTNLHSFTGSGDNLFAGLILSGNTLYGTAQYGGSSSKGTVFTVNTDGTGFTNLHSFTGSDGENLIAGLILSGNTLYGTAAGGGSSGNGTVFAVNTDGTGFTTLHSFTAATGPSYVNSDGANPSAGLILSGNTLYGTAGSGGSSGNGTVFSLSLPVPPAQLTLAPDGSGGYFVRVHGTPSLTYRLQRAHTLTGPWSTSAPQTAPASGLVEFWDLFQLPGQAFYRTVQP